MNHIIKLLRKMENDILDDIKYFESGFEFKYKGYSFSLSSYYINKLQSVEYVLYFDGIEYWSYFTSIQKDRKVFEQFFNQTMQQKPNLSEIEQILYFD